MTLIKLLIIDEDNEYSISLCNFLTHSYSETFAVYYCKDLNDINNSIKKIDPNVILSSEKYYCEIKNYTNIDLILLSSLKNPETTIKTDYIYKYKDVNQIALEIINIHTTTGNKIYNTGGRILKWFRFFQPPEM
ncbi:hypothetical protein [Ruminiclostridium papyrosolvens]|uniref:hypothetical protein n=1 Tax=Ruminiclostridium papyrosolvens TaxID=29362 RepID=UPI00041211AB|nr:hypothetical protein [Ruminiclostridium papyrosolvens]